MRWMWIDQIVEYSPPPEARMVAIKHVSLAEDHLHDHVIAVKGGLGDEAGSGVEVSARATGKDVGREAGARVCGVPVMPASLMIEGMAQTAGILVGSINRFQEKVILAKIAVARFDAEVFAGDTVRYEARLEHMHAAGASTTGVVSRLSHAGPQAGRWQALGNVNLMFSHLDQNMAGLEFPEGNFVFSDNFKMILRGTALDPDR